MSDEPAAEAPPDEPGLDFRDAGDSADDPAGDDDRAPSGVPAADAAAERLGAVREAPLEDHVEIYEDVHRRLQEGLADLDEQ
jgi:hypothetical protein